jgi:hypothetical protein
MNKYSIVLTLQVPNNPITYNEILYSPANNLVEDLTLVANDIVNNLVLYFRQHADSPLEASNNVIYKVMKVLPEAILLTQTVKDWKVEYDEFYNLDIIGD